MNRINYENQTHVIYGSPIEVVAAGTDRNLVQASTYNKRQPTKDELEKLDKILRFTELPSDRQKELDKERAGKNKNVIQGGLSKCKNRENLIKALNFGIGVE